MNMIRLNLVINTFISVIMKGMVIVNHTKIADEQRTAMDFSSIIKEVGRGKNHARNLDQQTAADLYRAILAGEVPDLELGGLLIAFRIKGEAEGEMLGFYDAMQEQVMALQAPADMPPPVVIPSYNGARKQANLTPLLALALSRLGFPVVVHGVTQDPSRVTSAEIFHALGIAPQLSVL